MLRRMRRLRSELIVPAFADDIAVVAPSTQGCMPTLMKLFEEMAKVAGLGLNLPKCVLIPLWPIEVDIISVEFASRFPAWAAIAIRDKGTYLGFVIGPGCEDSSWHRPLRKYLDCVKWWSKAGVGLHYASVAYSTYALPILSFVGQLCAPSLEVLGAEGKALHAMSHGPGNWCTTRDLQYMVEGFGQPRNFPSLAHMCFAAQKRVYQWENSAQGGLEVELRFSQLQAALAQSNHLDRYVRWHEWFCKGPIATLFDNSQRLDGLGLMSSELLRQAGWNTTSHEHNDNEIRKVRKKFQSSVRAALHKRDQQDPVQRIRKKLDRWNLHGIPNITANRCALAFHKLKKLVPPRVVAAVWKTMWNAWTTARRFQKVGSCLLCCGSAMGEDSIEHYARCSSTIHVGKSFVGLRDTHPSTWLGNFVALGLCKGSVDDKTLTLRAVLIYAVFRSTNYLRNNPTTSVDVVKDMLQQFAKEAVRGHPGATQMLDEFGRS